MRSLVRGKGPSSLHPKPARSYEHTRAKRETASCTGRHIAERLQADSCDKPNYPQRHIPAGYTGLSTQAMVG